MPPRAPRPAASLVDYLHRAVVLGLVGLTGWGIWITGAVYVSRIGTRERIPLESAINRNETLTDVKNTLTPESGAESEFDPEKKI